jgi:peptide/nickel transport system substrate-binding protein
MPQADLIASLKADPNISVEVRDKIGGYLMLQFNHVQPPFNNVAVRRAVALAMDQSQFLHAVASDPALMAPCYSVYACGTPYASEAGADIIKTADLGKARAALQRSGYAGEKVVLLAAQDGLMGGAGQVADDLFRRLGLNTELVAVDFATMVQRRLSKAPVDQGGWSAFVTAWTGGDILNPAVNPMLRGAGSKGYAGWAQDPDLETLRHRWAASVDPAERQKLAIAIQLQAFQSLPYLPLGSIRVACAFRKSVTGVFPAPVQVYWNIGKSA